MSDSNSKGIQAFVPNADLVKGTFSMVAFEQMIAQFIKYVQQQPIPQVDVSNPNGDIKQSVIDALKKINTSMSGHYTTIVNDAQTERTKVHQAAAVIGQVWHYSRMAAIAIESIYNAVENASGPLSKDDKDNITSHLQFIDHGLKGLEAQIPSDFLDGIQKKLNTDISNLASDFDDLQNAIPAGDGAKLDLSNLSEKEAKEKLDGQISSLNSDISTLQTEIAWETVGQVGIGIVGGIIAITNFWNPIGWAAAAGTVAGEVELAKDKASKKAQVALDQEKISVTEAEELILQPYYAVKHYHTQLKTMVDGLQTMSKGIGNIRSYLDDYLGDVDMFIMDLGDKEMLKDDYQLVAGDLSALEKCVYKLMSSDSFASQAETDPKWVTMAQDGKWQKILDDPNSPYYVKIIKDAKAKSNA